MISIPITAITDGPSINWKHADGPCITWASLIHWLSWSERLRLYFGFVTVEEIACKRWPVIAAKRDQLLERKIS